MAKKKTGNGKSSAKGQGEILRNALRSAAGMTDFYQDLLEKVWTESIDEKKVNTCLRITDRVMNVTKLEIQAARIGPHARIPLMLELPSKADEEVKSG